MPRSNPEFLRCQALLSRAIFDARIRLKAAEGIGRVFYCTMSARRIVMLHQFVKKSEKTPRRELETATRRLKEIIDAHS